MSRPHLLILGLVATSSVVSAVVAGYGWLLVDRQRAMDEGRVKAESEAAADTIAAGVRTRLTEVGDRLSTWLAAPDRPVPPIDAAVVVVRHAGRVTVTPAGGIPFVPETAATPDSGSRYEQGEALEFRAHDLSKASAAYDLLTRTGDRSLRAGALVRLARVLKKSDDFRGALRVYSELSSLSEVEVEGVPAGLISLDGERRMHGVLGDQVAARRAAAGLAAALDSGRWRLSRGNAAYYRDGVPDIPKGDRWPLAEAVANTWPNIGEASPRGQRARVEGDSGAVLVWRSLGSGVALAAFPAESFIAPIVLTGTRWQWLDGDGHRIAGDVTPLRNYVTRVAGSTDGGWELRVALSGAAVVSGGAGLIAMTVSTLAFVWIATYVMARSIRREATVARLQADFVAAVSHEFRSPLTSVRQMGEMLEMGRLQSDERRQQYYRAIVIETTRLQRLVEQVLNFGRLDSREVRYVFAPVDIGAVADLAISDVRPQAGERAIKFDVQSVGDGPVVHADADALRLAIRNLVENAVKYSPAGSTVTVKWSVKDRRVAVTVADHGPGIPRGEREAIFEKFVRGRAALDGNVKGTGVGLAIVRHVVRAHRGEIDVRSEPGQGSTFTLHLPQTQAHDAGREGVLAAGHPGTAQL